MTCIHTPSMTPNAKFSVAGMMAFNMALYLTVETLRMRPLLGSGFIINSLAHFGSFLFAICFSLAVLPKSAGDSSAGRTRRKRFFPVFVAVAILTVCFRFVGPELWQGSTMARGIVTLGMGFTGGLTYFFLFSFLPLEKRGFWFGCSLGLGLLTKLLADMVRESGLMSVRGGEYYLLIYWAAFAFQAIAVGLCLVVASSRQKTPSAAPVAEAQLSTPWDKRRRNSALRLMLAFCIIHTLNTFLSGRLFPVLVENASFSPNLTTFTSILGVVTTGWLMGRDAMAWAKRIVSFTAFVFILAPTMLVLQDMPSVFRGIHALATMAQMSIFVCITLALHTLSLGSRWNCLITGAPYVLRVFSLPGMLLFRFVPADNIGLLMTVAIAFGIIFYAIIGGKNSAFASLPEPLDDAPDAILPIAAPGPGAVDGQLPPGDNPPEGTWEQRCTELFSQYDLTRRESEIAGLLLTGISSADIAKDLYISENTVNTHVKNILRKFNLSTRKTFVATVLSELREEADAHEPDSRKPLETALS